jgi:uncharacterized membrane protein
MLTALMKNGSQALLHVAVAFGVAWGLSGSLELAAGIALVEPCVMSFAALLLERVWKAAGRVPPHRISMA